MLVFALASSTMDPTGPLRQRQPPPTPETIENFRDSLGLNDPFPVRYWNWLKGAVHGDFGKSINGSNVSDDLFTKAGVTLRMVTAAIILAVILAIVVGVITAVRQYKLSDYFFTTLSYMLIALPVFWFATLLKEFVAIQLNDLFDARIFFTQGEESPGISLGGTPAAEVWKDRLQHLILPTISLAALSFAAWSRFQRAAMLDVLGSDFMRLARAKGLTWPRALVRHGLRNALIPLTTIVALGIGALLGGAVITETVFNWHGMGEYLQQNALTAQDINVLLGWLTLAAFFIIALNLVADLLYAVLDPRIRLS